MSSITDVVKEGLKYPFNDGKKVLTLGVVFLVSSLVSLLMQYFVFDNMRTLADSAPIDTVHAALSALPPSNMALIVLFWIVTFILMIFCSGYVYDVIKYAIERRSDLPEFKDIKGIFIKGIRSLVVGIAYSILPIILFLLGVMLAVNESVGGSVNAIGGIIIVIAMAFAIFAALLQVMALCNMIDKDELAAAFRFKEILALIKNLGWGRYIGILLFTVIAVMIITVFFGFALYMAPFMGVDMISFVMTAALLLLGIRSLYFYFTMSRHMVGGKYSLFSGIILTDLGVCALMIKSLFYFLIIYNYYGLSLKKVILNYLFIILKK